jgi:threonine synthase
LGKIQAYRCSICGEEYDVDAITYVCPDDGGNLDVVLDFERIRDEIALTDISVSTEFSIWRYLPLLPVDEPGYKGTSLWSVGWTPLLSPQRLAERFGLQRFYLKDDGRNPTASFKDRASAVVVIRAEEIEAETVVTASTGNAGAALAGMAAAVGIPSVILAPKNAPQAKVAQLLMFGARVILVEGNYDDAFDLSIEAAQEFSWYCRNTGYNPFTAEGKKTAAFEICEQLTLTMKSKGRAASSWISPDAVFVSVGDGNIISGLHKGFKDLLALGWIDQLPRLYGVQSTGSAAVYNAFKANVEEIHPVQSQTLADSISVDMPRDGLRALRAATSTGGAYLAVTDEDILQAMRDLASEAAVFAEPAGATAYAGLIEAIAQDLVHPDEKIVVLNTGNGLKDVQAAMQAAGEATVIEPTLSALQKAIET